MKKWPCYVCIIIYGEEGDGKNRFIDLFNNIFEDNYFAQLDTAKKLFGTHSCVEKEKLFVCVNEAKGKDNYENYNVPNKAIQYPSNNTLTTEQSRATNPAWWYRDLEQNNFEYPPLNPQANVCIPFQNNLSTRVLEKDYYTPKRDCIVNESKNYLPISHNLVRGGFN